MGSPPSKDRSQLLEGRAGWNQPKQLQRQINQLKETKMNGFTRICVVLAAILNVILNGYAHAQSSEKPVRGEDLVYVPAIDEGLCVQSLFQSNMVLQREKPISIWGWADAGETVT